MLRCENNLLIVISELLINDVQLLFRGQQIDSLSSAKVIFWNRGKETIQHNHVVAADPIFYSA